MLITLLDIIHIFVCLFLMLVVLLQQGKGGGMGAAFGGGATQQVFGGRGAGNILTRATAICAGIFMLTSVSLAYFSSAGDRDLKQHIVEEQRKGKGNEGQRVKTPKAKPAATSGDTAPGAAPTSSSEGAAAPGTPATGGATGATSATGAPAPEPAPASGSAGAPPSSPSPAPSSQP